MDVLWNEMENAEEEEEGEEEDGGRSRSLSSAEKYRAQQQLPPAAECSRRFTPGEYLLRRHTSDPDPLREGSWQSQHQSHLQQLQELREEERRLEESLYSQAPSSAGILPELPYMDIFGEEPASTPLSRRSTLDSEDGAAGELGAPRSSSSMLGPGTSGNPPSNPLEERYRFMIRDRERSAIGEAHRGAYYTGSKAPTETDRKMRVRAARIDAELQRLAAMKGPLNIGGHPCQ